MKVCSVDGCERQRDTQGYCGAHWYRLRKNGDLLIDRPIARQGRPVAERFWEKVAFVGNVSECWEWQAARDPNGYGRTSNPRTSDRSMLAHRLSWELTNGPIPPGMHLLHLCDNPPCVNTHHLYLGTNAENAQDRVRAGTVANQHTRQTHCKRGHELTPENTARWGKQQFRQCRICSRLRQQIRTERMRAAVVA